MVLRYNEIVGTILNDSLTGGSRDIVFGNYGNDTLRSSPNVEEVVLVGGHGDDTYIVGNGTATNIEDSGSGNDTISIPGFTYANTSLATIDNRHLIAYDVNTNTQLLVLDWLDPKNAIETIRIADATFSTAQLSAELNSLPGFIGNISFESAGIIPTGFTSADLREAIEFYDLRSLQVHASNDLLNGGTGAENYSGYEGNDTINGNSGNDTIQGNQGADSLTGGEGNDSIQGGRDNDFVQGNQGADEVNGNLGDDTVFGGRDNDTVHGGGGNDSVNGNNGDDSVYGGLGDDNMNGGQGNDRLFGNDGIDLLAGDRGNDTLNGGAGEDVFFFSTESGQDVIEDFTKGLDKLTFFSAIGLTIEQILSQTSFSAGTVIINLGGINIITILGQSSILDSSDFLTV